MWPTGAPTSLPVLASAHLTQQSSGTFLFQDKCWHLHDYLVDTLGPCVISMTRVATACSQQGAMGTVPGETQDSWKPSAPAPEGSPGPGSLQLPLSLGLG